MGIGEHLRRLAGRMQNVRLKQYLEQRRQNIKGIDLVFILPPEQPEWSKKDAMRIALNTAAQIVRLRRYKFKKLREYTRFNQMLDRMIAETLHREDGGAAPDDMEATREDERKALEDLITRIILQNEERTEELFECEEADDYHAFIIKEDGTCFPPLKPRHIEHLTNLFDTIEYDKAEDAWRRVEQICELCLAHDTHDDQPFIFRQDPEHQERFCTGMDGFLNEMNIGYDQDHGDEPLRAMHHQLDAIIHHWIEIANRPENQMVAEHDTPIKRWQRLAERLPEVGQHHRHQM